MIQKMLNEHTAALQTAHASQTHKQPPSIPQASKAPNLAEIYDDASAPPKQILPYPHNLRVEKKSDTSIQVSWDPPTAPLSLNQSIEHDGGSSDLVDHTMIIQTYNIFLNNELKNALNGSEDRTLVLNDIDFSVANRISIQALTTKGAMSKPQECTLLFGANRLFSPSNLAVASLTQTSAVVSWWPSSSLFSHIISIDSIEHRTLKPGTFRFKLSGLLPDTSHLVTVTALIPNQTNESNHVASIEFKTLAAKTLAVPQDLTIEKDANEHETYVLSWKPVVAMPNMTSNGISVGGYSIYLDGVRVHQILNPIGE
jgi:hypothetical protein